MSIADRAGFQLLLRSFLPNFVHQFAKGRHVALRVAVRAHVVHTLDPSGEDRDVVLRNIDAQRFGAEMQLLVRCLSFARKQPANSDFGRVGMRGSRLRKRSNLRFFQQQVAIGMRDEIVARDAKKGKIFLALCVKRLFSDRTINIDGFNFYESPKIHD